MIVQNVIEMCVHDFEDCEDFRVRNMHAFLIEERLLQRKICA